MFFGNRAAHVVRGARACRGAVAGLFLALATACSTAAPPPAVPSLVDAKRQVGEYVASGRYEADIAAVVAEAKAYLAQRATSGARLAIVLDIDETSLSNVPALRANDYGFIVGGPCDLARGPCGFVAWVEMARAEPIRPERLRAAEARQPRDAVGRRVQGAERRKLTEQGYTIAVNVGDQASDLDGGYAERTFRLANPFYFVP